MSALDRLRERETWRPLAGFTAVVLVISWLYGLVTGTLAFGTVTLWDGWVRCIEAGPLPCEYIGHPLGIDANVASSLIYGTWALTRLGIATSTALNLLGIVAIAGGVAGLWYLVRRFGGTHVAAASAATLYFTAPLVLSHAGLYQLFLGFALLPVPVALVVAATSTDGALVSLRRAAVVGSVVAAGLVLVYLDPYPWVVATTLAGSTVAGLGLVAAVRRHWSRVGLAAVLLVALAGPGLVFRSAEASGGLETEMPADFYRGMGVDVGVALVPTTSSTFGDLTSLGHEPWRSSDFTGDGSQLGSSYLGIPLLAAACLGGLWLMQRARRRGDDRPLLVGAAVGAAICLVLSLGPSLKVLDRDPTPRGEVITFGDYLMPPEDATLEWPWSSVFDHQPLASMRATYRWQAGARVVLSLLAAVGIAMALRRRPVLALVLGGLLLLDTTPRWLWDRPERADAQGAELDRFVEDMEAEFGGGRLVEDERVLFLPAENDYLVQYIAPTFEVRTYNLSFDKAIAQIRPKQPAAIVEAIALTSDGELTSEHLCSLFRDDLVDAVVFDHFSLRWDSYRWPPPDAAVAEDAAALDESSLLETPGLVVDEGRLSVVTRAAADGPCAPAPS
jgi:hypothetical protein